MNNTSFNKVTETLFIVLVVGLCITFIKVFNISVIFVGLAAILLAILFYNVSHWIQSKFKLSYKTCYGLMLLVALGLIVLFSLFLWASISSQIDELIKELPKTLELLMDKAQNAEWSRKLMEIIRKKSESEGLSLGLLTASNALKGLGSLVVMVILAIFIGMDPKTYKSGVLSLFNKQKSKLKEFFKKAHAQLSHWLFAKLLAMLIISVLTVVGLMILNIRLALILGILAGLLSFIPNFGPLISAIPAVLLGLSQSSEKALMVLGLFTLIQIAESYVILPFIYKQKVSLPPALTLFLQILLGALFGIWGLALAAPMAVLGMAWLEPSKK